jgi:glycosyltransferase involved in cell wall biosynthesis
VRKVDPMCELTIAIPMYNGGHTVVQAIQSCIDEAEHFGIRILVVDNASTDGSKERIQKVFGARVDIIRHSSTLPIWSNHNSCLALSTSKYTVILHADDMLQPKAIERFMKTILMDEHQDNTIIWGRSTFYDYAYHLKREGVSLDKLFFGATAERVFSFGGLTSSGTLYPREFIVAGGFLEFDSAYMPSDLFSMILAAKRGFQFVMLKDKILSRYQSSTLDTAGFGDSKYQSYIQLAYEKYLGKLRDECIENNIGEIMCLEPRSLPAYRAVFLSTKHPLFLLRYLITWGFKRPADTAKVIKRTFFR